MNLIRHNAKKHIAAIFLLVTCSSLLVACGGSDSETTAGIGGTGIVYGKITGFGSVHVNGGKFEIDTSTFIVDGDVLVGQAGQDQLAAGMVVQLSVETLDGEFTNTALKVVYDDETEGPIETLPVLDLSGNKKTFTILGNNFTIDQTTTIFSGTCFDGTGCIGKDDVVEISGFRTSATDVVATYVEKKGAFPVTTEVEFKGNVSTPITDTTFMLGSVTVTFDRTDLPSGAVLTDGQAVEVKGTYLAVNSVDANDIEFEQEDFGDDVDDIDLQGIVLIYNGINNFFIGSQHVDASTADFSPTSLKGMDLLGMNIEVEGEIVDGTLIADEAEARDGDTKLRSVISEVVDTVDDQFFKVSYPVAAMPNEVTVRIDGQTLFEDETDTFPSTVPFSLDDLVATDFVRVEGQEVGGEVVASVVKRTDGTGQGLKLEGAVDSFVTDSSITILRITYDVNPTPGETDFGGLTSAAFFDALNPLGGDFVEIEDDDVANGFADEVELE